MKASRLAVSIAGAATLLGAGVAGAQNSYDSQDKARSQASNCVDQRAAYDERYDNPVHDSVYESLNGITNTSPVRKPDWLNNGMNQQYAMSASPDDSSGGNERDTRRMSRERNAKDECN